MQEKRGKMQCGRRCAVLCALALVLAAMLAVLPGCKYSDVLTMHLEDPDIGTLDENAEPIYEQNPDAEQRPDLADVSVDDADDENTQVQTLPHYDPNAPDNGPTTQRLKSPDTPHEEEATEGQEPDADQEPDRQGEATREDSEEQGSSDEPDPAEEPDQEEEEEEQGENEGGGQELTDDEAEDPQESQEGGGGGTTVVVDPEDGTNNNDDLAKGTVAAVGEYATIAQMLGGAGALAACDQEWLDARQQDGTFPGELERVEAAFSGDGTQAGSCNVDALVNTIQPSAVLWDSTANVPNLSESDRAALEAAGIRVQGVPHIGELTTADISVVGAVQEVAGVLSGASGLDYDPAGAAEMYQEFHDRVLKKSYEANKGYSYKVTDSQYAKLYQDTPLAGLTDATTTRVTTVYAASMMTPSVSSAKVAQTATTSDGVIRLAHDGQTLDVSDGVALSATSNTGQYLLMDYYLQLAGIMNNSYDGDKPDSQGRPFIIMPGSTTAFGTSDRFGSRISSSALFYNAGDATVTANWHVLGNDDFPAILAADTEIAGAIAASAAKSDGLYHMEKPYQITVVPSGIAGIWSEGHVDSFLLSLWAFRVKDTANLEYAAKEVASFYKTFFRCDDWEEVVADWDSAYTAR